MRKLLLALFILAILPSVGQTRYTFNDFIDHFLESDQKIFERSYFVNDSIFIDKEAIASFLPTAIKKNCTKKDGLAFLYGHKIVTENYFIVFVDKWCDIPLKYSYPYSADVLLVYSKQGKLLDYTIVSEGSDIANCSWSGTLDPFNLIVEQAYMDDPNDLNKVKYPRGKAQVCQYTVNSFGKIIKTILKKDIPGYLCWDIDKYIYKFVRDK